VTELAPVSLLYILSLSLSPIHRLHASPYPITKYSAHIYTYTLLLSLYQSIPLTGVVTHATSLRDARTHTLPILRYVRGQLGPPK
jgi:hypothetical protein